jgi:hypothetical protein
MYESLPPEENPTLPPEETSPDASPPEEPKKSRIKSQDLEHQPRPDTRVNNSGVKVRPSRGAPSKDDATREAEV